MRVQAVRVGVFPELSSDCSNGVVYELVKLVVVVDGRILEIESGNSLDVGLIDEADLEPTRSLGRLVRRYVYHPEWTEVIRLVAAQVTPPRAEELIRIILEDSAPTGRFLYRGPLLALWCLVDGTTVANRDLVVQLFESLEDLGRSRWLGITMDVLEAANSLHETRYAGKAEAAVRHILAGAKQHLPDDEYESLVFSSRRHRVDSEAIRGWRQTDDSDSPILLVTLSQDGRRRELVIPNVELLASDPEAWHESARTLLESEDASVHMKDMVLWQMGMLAKQNNRARMRLKRVLRDREEVGTLRATAARSLAILGVGPGNAKAALLGELANLQNSDELREACAYALRVAAVDNQEARRALVEILNNCDEAENVRIGAAFALADAASDSESVADLLFRWASDEESESLASACIQCLEAVGERFIEAVSGWALGSDWRTRPACMVAAEMIISSRIDWNEGLASRIESMIMSAGKPDSPFGEPCPHALRTLRRLSDVRERRRGLNLENVFADSLQQFSGQLSSAFVCGSDVRTSPEHDTSLKLFLLGPIPVADFESAVHDAENRLGKTVTPTAITVEGFAKKVRSDEEFASRLRKTQKVFIKLGDSAANDEDLAKILAAFGGESTN